MHNGKCSNVSCGSSYTVTRSCQCPEDRKTDLCIHCIEKYFLQGGDCPGCMEPMGAYIMIAHTSYRRFAEFETSFEDEIHEGERQLNLMARELENEVNEKHEEMLKNKQLSAQISVLQSNLQLLDTQINCLKGLMNTLARIHGSVTYLPKDSDYAMRSPLNRRKHDEDEDEDEEDEEKQN